MIRTEKGSIAQANNLHGIGKRALNKSYKNQHLHKRRRSPSGVVVGNERNGTPSEVGQSLGSWSSWFGGVLTN